MVFIQLEQFPTTGVTFPEDFKHVRICQRKVTLVRQSTDTNNLTATIWMDRKIVSVLTE